MVSIKLFFFLALAVAMVVAFPEEAQRVKKQVLLGGYPYAYAAPIAYSAYPAAPLAYTYY